MSIQESTKSYYEKTIGESGNNTSIRCFGGNVDLVHYVGYGENGHLPTYVSYQLSAQHAREIGAALIAAAIFAERNGGEEKAA